MKSFTRLPVINSKVVARCVDAVNECIQQA